MKIFKLCLAFLLVMMGFGLKAEIVYTPTGLSIDALYEHALPADLKIGLPGGLIMKGSNPEQMFKIYIPTGADVTYPSPSISGYSCISFYNPLYKSKLSITTRQSFTASGDISSATKNNMPQILPTMLSASKSVRRNTAGQKASKDMEYDYLKLVAPGAIRVVNGDTIVNYQELVPMLFKAAQELNAQISEQEQMIDQLTILLNSSFDTSKLGSILGCSPNPTSGYVTVSYTLDENAFGHKTDIRVTDTSGYLIYSHVIDQQASALPIDLSAAPKGIYLISLTIDNVVADTFRLIKN